MTRQGEWHMAHTLLLHRYGARVRGRPSSIYNPQGTKGSAESGTWRELTDSRISVLSHTPAFLEPKNQESELRPPRTFWKIIHSFTHLFTHLSTR